VIKKSNLTRKSIRKIVQVGNSSGITLPVDYFESIELERGDKVETFYDYEGNILIKPISDKEILEKFRNKEASDSFQNEKKEMNEQNEKGTEREQ